MLLNLPLMMTAQPRPFPSQFVFLFLYFFPVHIFLLRSLFPPSTWAPLTNWKCNLAKVQHCVAYYCAPPRPSATLWALPAACPLPCRQRGALAIVQAGQRTTEVAVSRWLKVPAVTQNVWKTMQFFHLSQPHTHTHSHAHAHTHAQAESEVACLMHDFAFFVVRSDQRVRTKASWSWLVVSAPVQFLWLAVGNYGNCLVCLAKGCVQIDGEFMSALWIFKLTNGKIKLRDYQV